MPVLVKEKKVKRVVSVRGKPLTPLESYRLGLTEPEFRGPDELSPEQLSDVHYAMKQLEKLNEGSLDITCSMCHHCR